MTTENKPRNAAASKKPVKKKPSALKLVLLSLMVVMFIAAAFLLSRYEPDAGLTAVPNAPVSEKTQGFPFTLEDADIESAACASGNLFALTRQAVYCVSPKGDVVFSHPLALSEPALKTGGDYCLVYDAGGSEYLLFGEKGLVLKGESEEKGKILTAAVSGSGRFLIASRKNGATSSLTCYGKSGEMVFGWNCAKEHIVSLAVSDNGGTAACAALGSASGKLYSVVTVFDAFAGEVLRKEKFKSKTAAAVQLSGSNAVAVFTDSLASFNCKNDKDVIKTKFASPAVRYACDGNGCTAVLTKNPLSGSEQKLTLFDAFGKILFEAEIKDEVRDMKAANKKVYVMTSAELLVFSRGGDSTSRALSGTYDRLAADSRRSYFIKQGMIDKF